MVRRRAAWSMWPAAHPSRRRFAAPQDEDRSQFAPSSPRHCEWSDLSAEAHRAKAEAIHSFFARQDGLPRRFAPRNDGVRHEVAISRHHLPEVLHFVCPLKEKRARGRPGARCTRGLAGCCKEICCPRAYRFSGEPPAFPAQWLYGLYDFVLVTGFLATIPPWKR